MSRPWHIWLTFSICLIIGLAAMGWVSHALIGLERDEIEAQSRATYEENVRLALWRLDSAVTPLVSRESVRRYFTYSPFYPVQRAYNKMFAQIQANEIMQPSPLLTRRPEWIVLHFQINADGSWHSPQAPTGNMQDLAEGKRYVTHEQVQEAAGKLKQIQRLVRVDQLQRNVPPLAEDGPPALKPVQDALANNDAQTAVQQRGADELTKRAQRYQAASVSSPAPGTVSAPSRMVQEGPFVPMWVGNGADELIFARRVRAGGQEYVQGFWLDWTGIRSSLLGDIRDLLPAAKLAPHRPTTPGDVTRVLAALPACLEPGEPPVAESPFLTPLRISLVVAWIAMVLAALAVGILLWGTVSLSERRAEFVSAVTHELRTPLTTFRMYTEMLSEKMVPTEEKRQSYLRTMRSEADRLGHLVENVLSFARLERGRADEKIEKAPASDFIERVRTRLAERAGQVGMAIEVEASGGDKAPVVQADPSAVEQILFNLVDNACKYGRDPSKEGDARILLSAKRQDGFGVIRVRDEGPGVSEDVRRRLFQPFSKTAHQAAHSAPGIGLGLALCRRLARRMGGELSLDDSVKDGACFELKLPLA